MFGRVGVFVFTAGFGFWVILDYLGFRACLEEFGYLGFRACLEDFGYLGGLCV